MPRLCPECHEPPHYHSWCTRCAQLFRARRTPATATIRPCRKGHWTARRDEVAALRRAGLSYAQIARQFGVTRSAISGAVHRHVRKACP
jgi:DNA-binding NarL/FixJ family response regulator